MKINQTKLKSVTFAGSTNLGYLSYRAFYDSYSVQELDLTATNVSAIEESLILYAPNLRKIKVSQSGLRCDCINEWLLSDQGKMLVEGILKN